MPRSLAFCALLTGIVTALVTCDTDAAVFVQGGVSGSTTTDDAGIDSFPTSQNINSGTDSRLLVGQLGSNEVARGLIRFDLSSIAGQYTQIAKIELTLGIDFSSGATISLHEVGANNGNWTEFEATWNTKNGVTAWDGGAGLGTAGYGSLLTSLSIANAQTGTVTWTISDAVVATMLVDHFTTGSNEGFLLKSTDESTLGYVNFNSAEWATPSRRPTLTITYTVPEPSTACMIGCTAALLGFWRRRV